MKELEEKVQSLTVAHKDKSQVSVMQDGAANWSLQDFSEHLKRVFGAVALCERNGIHSKKCFSSSSVHGPLRAHVFR